MAKTEELPAMEGEGVAPKKIKKLDNAIALWRSIVEQRMTLTENEVLARQKVQDIMEAEKLTKYAYWVSDEEQKDVVLDETVKVKLTKHKEGAAEAEAPENEED